MGDYELKEWALFGLISIGSFVLGGVFAALAGALGLGGFGVWCMVMSFIATSAGIVLAVAALSSWYEDQE